MTGVQTCALPICIAAQAAGMRTLRQDGIEKALLGLVRIEDVRAATNL